MMTQNQRFDAQRFVERHVSVARKVGTTTVKLRKNGLLTPESFADWAELEGDIFAQIKGDVVYLAIRQ